MKYRTNNNRAISLQQPQQVALNIDRTSVGYCGKDIQELFTELFYGSRMAENMRIINGITGTGKAVFFTRKAPVQGYTCNFNPCGGSTFTQKTVTVCDYQVSDEWCKTDLTKFLCSDGIFAEPSGFNPPESISSLADIVVSQTMVQVQEQIDVLIWQSDTATPSVACNELTSTFPTAVWLCDGLIKRMDAPGSGVIPVAGVPLTALNVLAELDRLWAAIPSILITTDVFPQLRIYANPSLVNLFTTVFNNTQGIYQNYESGVVHGLSKGPGMMNWNYNGVPFVFSNGVPVNTLVATYSDNLWLITDLRSDWESIQVIDMQPTTLADQMRLKMSFRLGADFGFGQYIVKYQ